MTIMIRSILAALVLGISLPALASQHQDTTMHRTHHHRMHKKETKAEEAKEEKAEKMKTHKAHHHHKHVKKTTTP